MTMNKALITFLLALFSYQYPCNASTSARIDEIRSFDAVILPDQVPVTISLHFFGASMSTPIKWTVDVKDHKGQAVLSFSGDDSQVDASFGPRLVNGCSGYEDCKRLWYYEDFAKSLKAMCGILPPMPPANPNQLNGSHGLENDFLIRKGIPEARRKSIIQEIDALTMTGNFGICWSWKNLEIDTEYVFVPSIGYFVPHWRKS